MLQELGCRYVLVGHSERRAYHGESDALVAAKAQAALGRGVTPIVCVGETLAEREAGQTAEVVLDVASYISEIARARTFGFMQDVETLRGMGLARGGSLENAIVMDEFRILNSGGLRYRNAFVRHTILNSTCYRYLSGHPLLDRVLITN